MIITCSFCGQAALDDQSKDLSSRIQVSDVLCSCKVSGVVAAGVFIPFRDIAPIGHIRSAIVDGKIQSVLVSTDNSVELIGADGVRKKLPPSLIAVS
jgi:hypothetical protein